MKKIIVLFLASVAAFSKGEQLYSFPAITHWDVRNVGIQIGFQTTPKCKYTVQSSTNLYLNCWKDLTNFTADGYSFSMYVSSDEAGYGKKQFVRFIVDCPVCETNTVIK